MIIIRRRVVVKGVVEIFFFLLYNIINKTKKQVYGVRAVSPYDIYLRTYFYAALLRTDLSFWSSARFRAEANEACECRKRKATHLPILFTALFLQRGNKPRRNAFVTFSTST